MDFFELAGSLETQDHSTAAREIVVPMKSTRIRLDHETVRGWLTLNQWFDCSDGVGIVWTHPHLVGHDGSRVSILVEVAVDIQRAWDRRADPTSWSAEAKPSEEA